MSEQKEETGACGVHRFCYEKDYVKKSIFWEDLASEEARDYEKEKFFLSMMLVYSLIVSPVCVDYRIFVNKL